MGMVRSFIGLVERKVLLDDPTAQHDGSQSHHMARRMIRVARQAVEGTLVGLQHVHVGAIDLRGVVGDTLHEHEVAIARLLDCAHGLVDLRHRGVTSGQHHGNALASRIVKHFKPGNLT